MNQEKEEELGYGMLLLDIVCEGSSIILGSIAGIPSHPNLKFNSEGNVAVRSYGFR